MIQFSHVYKTYGGSIHALQDINLQIEKGEFVFLTGPSGAGKTTLFKLIAGYDRACSGLINIADFNINEITQAKVPFLRRKIGVVYQDFKLLKNKTVFENIAMPLVIRGEGRSYIERRVNEVLKDVSLEMKKNKNPEFLSGGEQQRVAIARALVHYPGVLIADEPTGNLDPELSNEIMDLLDKVNAQGTTIFVATHDHEMVKTRNKRVVHIVNGHIEKNYLSEVQAP